MKLHNDGYVYFAKAIGGEVDGLIKVGCCEVVRNRLLDLGGKYRTKMSLLGVGIPGQARGYKIELFVHRLFASDLRFRREWFAPSTDLYYLIDRCNHDSMALVKAHHSKLTRFDLKLARERAACLRDHEDAAFEHRKYQMYERPSVYRPINLKRQQLAADITRAIVAPPTITVLVPFAPVEKAA